MLDQFFGNYLIESQLGEGGMGVVYTAVHRHLGRRVALKVLHRDYSQQRDSLSRFFIEARAANLVQHPSIVDVYEFGISDDGRAYIVMELLSGVMLHRRICEAGRIGTRCLSIARQIAEALVFTHERGVVHRDLKPENIMLVPSLDMPGHERVKLLDFGLAKLLEQQPADLPVRHHPTRTGVVMGTPAYIAPEQARGDRSVGTAADVYSLGVMLYEMLCGRLPFERDSPMELVLLHMFGDPPPLTDYAPAVPRPVLRLVEHMMKKEPTQRPTMVRVAEELAKLESLLDADVPATLPVLSPQAQFAPTQPGLPSIVMARAQQALPELRAQPRKTSLRQRSSGALILVALSCLLAGDGGARPPERKLDTQSVAVVQPVAILPLSPAAPPPPAKVQVPAQASPTTTIPQTVSRPHSAQARRNLLPTSKKAPPASGCIENCSSTRSPDATQVSPPYFPAHWPAQPRTQDDARLPMPKFLRPNG